MAHTHILLSLYLLLLVLSVSAHGGDSDSDSISQAEKPNLRSPALVLVKIWCLIIVFVATFAGGMSPYFMKWNEGFLVLGTQFAGGVFLGTSLMHFLDDSNATFDDLTSVQYPFAFMLACAGYLMTMSADCIVSRVYNKYGSSSQNGSSSIVASTAHHPETKPSSSFRDDQTQESHHVAASLSTATSFGDSILLIIALCFHSVFEGIAIGVAETKQDAWRALWTVCLHKIFAAVAMGISLLRMIPNRPLLSSAVYAFLFAISSPIGVAIGIVIDATTQGRVADWIYAISMGLACGVFIYVCITHLITKGYQPQKRVPVNTEGYRFLAVLFGVAVIAVVMIWDT